ncbi:MAG: ABC transporter permease [Wenzhouxiangellaceae bacterium]|nr:ABC transporter permease [Wenzhouxiangellaceae bacterium]
MNIAIRTLPGAWMQLIRAQFLNLSRTPAYTLPTLLFPVMFYAFFGLLMIPGRAQFLLCTFATFGVMGAALFSFGIAIAMERAQGWMRLLRAAPAPISGVVTGKFVAAMLFALAIVALMSVLAAGLGGVRLATGQWLALAGVLAAGTLPFCLLGMALGLWLSPSAAPAVINIVYLPLAFLSGLWVPASQFPAWLQAVAEWLPPYHLAELALHVTGTRAGDWVWSAAVLAAYSITFAAAVAFGWRRLDGIRK